MITAMHRLILVCAMVLSHEICASTSFESSDLKRSSPFLSDDGSEIRSLPALGGVEVVHCRLAKDGVIQASRHKTVSQIWYVLTGIGELWLKAGDGKESIVQLKSGTSVTVPLGYAFQFRNISQQNLDILIINTTKWTGIGELIPVNGPWQVKEVRARK